MAEQPKDPLRFCNSFVRLYGREPFGGFDGAEYLQYCYALRLMNRVKDDESWLAALRHMEQKRLAALDHFLAMEQRRFETNWRETQALRERVRDWG